MAFDPVYAREKLYTAASILMLPDGKQYDQALSSAFFEISLALVGIDPEKIKASLDDSDAELLQTIVDTLDTTGLTAVGDEGLYILKARSLSELQIHDFCEAVLSLSISLGR
ncbi:MAG: hypothetical protein DCF18_10080 [Cyanobium sp.]|uniref:hypothetical protein n=1 Tax=Synechococcus sp. CS-1333 TaxID=2848638 RepID=UPI000DBC326A|nr:hypothetical protein [Synechococcus sp. CS-1333]MCT0211145.1 hypothetical protein [Synechococcus sp. CS-1333]PZV22361.1 MAG: hypothetical protein DCF18_10080 [Cyanobium sp.]